MFSTFRGPFSGPYFLKKVCLHPEEARAVWQWTNALHASCSPTKTTVTINFDETCVMLFQHSSAGLLVSDARRRQRNTGDMTANVSLRQQRTNMTYLAFITDSDEVQKLLPQVMIVSTKSLSDVDTHRLQMTMPSNIHVFRRTKAWLSQTIFMEILNLLATSIERVRGKYEFILCADAFRVHISRQSLQHYGRLGHRFACIPTGMIYLLQPADTHLFSRFKHALRVQSEIFALRRMKSDVNMESLIRAVGVTIMKIVCGQSWKAAFRDLGLNGDQHGLSRRVREKLHMLPTDDQVPKSLPSLAQLESVFPKNSLPSMTYVFSFFTLPRRPASTLAAYPLHFRSSVAPREEATHIPVASPAQCPPTTETQTATQQPPSRMPVVINARRMRVPIAYRSLSPPPLPPPAAPPLRRHHQSE